MSDSMMELLELVENNKEQMDSSAYLNLVTGVNDLYKRTNGNFTTDFRQMYLDLQKESDDWKKFLDIARDTQGIYWTYRSGIGIGLRKTKYGWRRAIVETHTKEGSDIRYFNTDERLPEITEREYRDRDRHMVSREVYRHNQLVSREVYRRDQLVTASSDGPFSFLNLLNPFKFNRKLKIK